MPNPWSDGARLAWRLLFSHHPLCSRFRSDTFLLGGVRVCSGCLLTWPAFLLFFAGFVFVGSPFSPETAIVVGLSIGLLQVLSATVVRARWFSRMAKVLGAPALALVVWGILWLRLPLPSLALVIAAGTAGFAALIVIRMRCMLAVCQACPYKMDWEICPGFLGHGRAPEPL
jgi:hypothetical protein